MIGQRELLKKINGQIERDKFPRFSILIGEQGCGKKTLAMEIAKRLKGTAVIANTKVDMIREIIDMAYKVSDTMVYIIPDSDSLSSASANALLKITEEPPKKAYFILTCENADNLLPTIKSRGVTYMLEPYTYEDKCDYIDTQDNRLPDETVEFILDVATTIGDIRRFFNLDIEEFIKYVNLVVDNIAEVSGSNAFKIADKIALKDEDDKYDLRLFWKAFSSVCIDRLNASADLQYGRAVAITGDALQQLSIRGINKSMLFDSWLLDIRSEWM
jgi:DNA polymerase III delta prime subunit